MWTTSEAFAALQRVDMVMASRKIEMPLSFKAELDSTERRFSLENAFMRLRRVVHRAVEKHPFSSGATAIIGNFFKTH